MLPWNEYLETFTSIQNKIIPLTEELAGWIRPGQSEAQIADEFRRLLARVDLIEHWYPILVCSGMWSGKPISRRVHLPSDTVVVRTDDIIVLDSTPLVGTVWGNWSKTFFIGRNSFFEDLCTTGDRIADDTATFARSSARTIGEIFDYCISKIREADLKLLDSRGDVGHSIFQVPVGQTVDKTPELDRLFISEEYRTRKPAGILSIEPQVGRIYSKDGIMYGVKQQRIVVCDDSLESDAKK